MCFLNVSIHPVASVKARGMLPYLFLRLDFCMFSIFGFQFFNAPAFISAAPRTASLEGRVPACSACLRNDDGQTVSIWLSGFPATISVSQLEVQFGDIKCIGSACKVVSVDELFQAGSNILYLTVTVPAAMKEGSVDLSVKYVGYEAPFADQDPDGSSQRAVKAAVAANYFSYLKTAPRMATASFCRVCHAGPTCIVAGMCGDFVIPPASTVEYLGVARVQGRGTLTLVLDHFGRVLARPEILVKIGTSAAEVLRVTSSTPDRTVMEVAAVSTDETGIVESSLRIGDFEVLFKILLIDDSITVECVLGCQGPSEGSGSSMELMIRNHPLDADTVRQLAETITVYFCSVLALNVVVTIGPDGVVVVSFSPRLLCRLLLKWVIRLSQLTHTPTMITLR